MSEEIWHEASEFECEVSGCAIGGLSCTRGNATGRKSMCSSSIHS
jgi:hypothetical protein